MTAVFVHGVPETADIWDGVRRELSDFESVALSLPGFGVPVPNGFGATMDEYADWLVGELETFDAPVDLVGHDWGGLLTGRLVSIRPDLVRSWVSDAARCRSSSGPRRSRPWASRATTRWRWSRGPELAHVPAPGMVLLPTDDPFNDGGRAQRVAERTGARLERLEGVSHFWPYQAPERGAAALRAFWESLPA